MTKQQRVCKRESSVDDRLFQPTLTLRKRAHRYSETRSRSNVRGACACWKTDMIKLTFSVDFFFFFFFWLQSQELNLLEWFWWHLWAKVAFKMFKEFPSASFDVTSNDKRVSTLKKTASHRIARRGKCQNFKGSCNNDLHQDKEGERLGGGGGERLMRENGLGAGEKRDGWRWGEGEISLALFSTATSEERID